MLLASGVNFGLSRTIPHLLGVNIGFGLLLVGVGLGLHQLFLQFPWLYVVLKIISIFFILTLAYNIARAGSITQINGKTNPQPMSFTAAVMFQAVNPKAWMMCLSSIAAYTVPSQYIGSLLLLTLIFTAVNLPCVGAWVGFGMALRNFLNDPKKIQIFNITMAVLLVASLWPVIAHFTG